MNAVDKSNTSSQEKNTEVATVKNIPSSDSKNIDALDKIKECEMNEVKYDSKTDTGENINQSKSSNQDSQNEISTSSQSNEFPENTTLNNECSTEMNEDDPSAESAAKEEGFSELNENKSPQLLKQLKTKPLSGQKRARHAAAQKKTDGQGNNEYSNSTGSDCDEGPKNKRPHHQKPHKMVSKPRPKPTADRTSKKNKLIKRKETKSVKAKALLHHHPTPEDISNLLKEFTIDFMLNGYTNLVSGLQCQVLLPYQMELDKSHLLWLITYFLRFAVELDLELSQISPILSTEVNFELRSFQFMY